jgi:taurine transport system substrate-binding protein
MRLRRIVISKRAASPARPSSYLERYANGIIEQEVVVNNGSKRNDIDYLASRSVTRRQVLAVGTASAVIAAALRGGPAFGQVEERPAAVRLGVATIPKIWALGRPDGTYEKAFGVPTQWVSYDSGAVLLPMFAAGQVDIAILGSPPIAASIARKLPIKIIGAPEIIDTSERLIGREGINTIKDLEGKRVAFPGASTLHYALESAIRIYGVDGQRVHRITLAQPEIVAAWRRGDIDAAYIAGPFWSELLANGGHQVLASGQLQSKGCYVFNGVIVRTEFANKYPATAIKCLQVMQTMYERYKQDASGTAERLAKDFGAPVEGTKQSLAGLTYPTFEEQLTPKYFGSGSDTPTSPLVKAMDDTGRFLADLGEIRKTDVPQSYASSVDIALMRKAFPAT